MRCLASKNAPYPERAAIEVMLAQYGDTVASMTFIKNSAIVDTL